MNGIKLETDYADVLEDPRNRDLANWVESVKQRYDANPEGMTHEINYLEAELRSRRAAQAVVVEISPARVFNPHPKHDQIAAWDNASVMDLDHLAAQEVLDHALEVPSKKQLIGVRDNNIYAFQPDNAGTYHGYLITGKELCEKYPLIAREIAQVLGITYKRLSRKE